MTSGLDWRKAKPPRATETLGGVVHNPGYRPKPPKRLPPSKADLRQVGAEAIAEWQARKPQEQPATEETPPWD